ncbi:MAG: hypothetical protein AB3N28_10605 [Kordiimonas sp.]
MLSNVNALLIAWAVSLIIVVGGVLTLEATYTPAPPAEVTEQTSSAPQATANTDTASDTYAAAPSSNQAGNAVTGLPAPGEVTTPTQRLSVDTVTREIPAVAIPELLEQSDQGPLPKISEDGRKPFDAYAASAPLTNIPSRIALMVTDLGLKSRTTQNALAELPRDIGLAFSP